MLPFKHLISARHVLHFAALGTMPVLTSSGPRSLRHCHDSRPLQRGPCPELPPLKGYEPNRIVLDHEKNMHFTEDDQITELEDRVKPLSYNQSFLPSTYDPAESIATPPESDFDDEQLRALVASPVSQQERGAKCRTITSLSLRTRKLYVQFISKSDNWRCIQTCRSVFSSQSELNQDTFSDGDQFSLKHQQFFGSIEPNFQIL